jgi:predicted transcriptional regulator
MVRRRRGESEIIMDILRAVFDGAKKTHIMYGANLSYRSFISAYKDSDGNDVYRLTDKGRALLRDGMAFYMNLLSEKSKPVSNHP